MTTDDLLSPRTWQRARTFSPAIACLLAAAVMPACSSSDSGGRTGTVDEALTTSGTIKNAAGLCVDVQWAGTANGTPIQIYDCDGTAAQSWTYTGGALKGLDGKCLDVKGGVTTNGTAVQLYDCNGTAAQQWSFSGGKLVGIGGKCLDVNGTDNVQTHTLWIESCDGSTSQEFTFGGSVSTSPDAGSPPGQAVAPGTYVLESGTLAVDGGFGHYNDTPAVQFYSAASVGSNTYQEWTLSAAGTLLNVGMGTDYLVDHGDGTASETATADDFTVTASGAGYTIEDKRTGKYLTNNSGTLGFAATGTGNQVFKFVSVGGTTPPVTDAGSPPVVDSGPPTPPPVSGNAAQKFLADLTFGIWMPRAQQTALTYNGTKVYESAAFFSYLAGLGVTHVAMSYPWTPCGGSCGDLSFIGTPSTTDGDFSSMLAAAKLAQAAGLKVAMRLTDNLTPGSSDFGTTLDNWEVAAGKAVAASGLDPARTLVIPWGEMAGSNNATTNPLITHGDQVLRTALPQAGGWILGVSGAYWSSSTVINGDSSGQGRSLVTLSSGATDEQVIYVWDDYPIRNQGLANSEGGYAANIDKWRAAHGSPAVLNLETGDWLGQTQYDTDPGNPGAWASSYEPIAQGVGKYASVLWDFSNADGEANQATLANGTEAVLSSANASGLKAACAYIKSQSYFGNGALR